MIPVLLSLVAFICTHCSNAQSLSSCSCLTKPQFMEILQAKGIVPCDNAVNNLTSIGLSDTPTVTVTTISQPIDMLLVGNDVYITSYDTARIYKLDRNGNQLDVIQLSPSTLIPRFMELHDNKIYVTTIGSIYGVYVSTDINSNNPLVFTPIINNLPIQPNAITFTPDGNHFLLGSKSNDRVYVYNSNTLINERIIIAPSAGSKTRDIEFDAYGNVYISTTTNVIKVFSPEYEFIRDIIYPQAEKIDNIMFLCDGSKIFVDLTSRSILLADRDDNIVDTFSFSTLFSITNALRTIIITNNGRTFVNNKPESRVYIFNHKP